MTNYQIKALCHKIKDFTHISGKSGKFTTNNSNYFEYKHGNNYLTIYEDNELEWRGTYGHYSPRMRMPEYLEKQIIEILNTDYMESDIKPQVWDMEDEIKEWECIYFITKFDNIKKTIKKEITKIKDRIVEIQA